MARYNEIYQRTWESESFKNLSKAEPNAQTLWLYLLTGRIKTPLPGIYGVGIGALQDFLKWSRESLTECFLELSNNDMAKVDYDANVIYLPNWHKWNKPQNPNVVKSWITLLDNIPDCNYKLLYLQQLKSLLESFGESFLKPFQDHYGNHITNPKPEPIPKPEPNHEPNKELPDKSDFQSLFDEFWKIYPRKSDKKEANELFIKHLKKQKDYQAEFEIIMNGVKRYSKYLTATNTSNQYYKNPASWIRKQKWNDELEIPETTEEYIARVNREHDERHKGE